MIRTATWDDFEHIMDMTHAFNNEYTDLPLVEDKVAAMLDNVIPNGVCFVSDGGYIGGIVSPDLFHATNSLIELAWYAQDNSGLRLLKAFVDEGRRLNVDAIRICTMSTSPKFVDKVLRAQGFTLAESSYILRP